jgi:ATP-dependent exoDNAse (exonuclease V) beta subunit
VSLAFRVDDEGARRQIRTVLDRSLIVEAAAGTGKTTEMVRRIAAVIERGLTTIDRVVAVTFTRKAAGELKLRLRQELDAARGRADAGARARLEEAVAHLEEAHIGTIHSFCGEILRERPVEALVDPAFEELSEVEAPRLYKQVFRRWMQEKLNVASPGLERALSRLASRDWDDRTPMEQLEDAGWKLIEWRDFPGEWRREEFALEREIDELVRGVRLLEAMAGQCRRTNDNLRKSLEPAVSLAQWIARAEDVRERDYYALEGMFIKLLRDLKGDVRKGSGAYGEGVTREEVLAARDGLTAALESFKQRADADLAGLLQVELTELVPLYDDRKRRAGKLDFLDLLICVRDLVAGNGEVRRYLQERFSHIFVDEFQDTDPLQAEILILLSADDPAQQDWLEVTPAPGKLFVVGDPKQSVYRFRRADVMLYGMITSALTSRGVELVRLSKSFRAVPEIQRMVNAAFAPEMTGDTVAGQPEYVPLAEHALSTADQPPLVVLPVPEPYGKQRLARASVEQSLPDACAAWVDWLLKESGWTVRDPDGRRVAVEAAHVCLLFRRFLSYGRDAARRDVTRDYTRALEARGIPHLLVGAKSFHHREEVETMRAALTAVEWPDDELSVFATLKGSLFAIPDSLLLRFRSSFGSLHPFRKLPDEAGPEFAPVAEALGLLAKLHRERNRRPLVATVSEILEQTRAHAGFALRPGGNQVLANVNRVCDLARSFELGGGISFRGFVEELNQQAEREESVEAPVIEEGADGVRIMTVHTAKGLEFPVVLLADITANISSPQPDRHVDPRRRVCATRLLGCTPWDLIDHQPEEGARDRAEGVRIAYVAATRARDLLVVPAVGDGPLDGWLTPLNKSIYPARERARASKPAPLSPKLGEDTVLRRPPDFNTTPPDSVRPGLHDLDGYGVVWWDPHKLGLNAEAKFGLRQEEILAEDAGAQAASEGIRRYREWQERRAEILAAGGSPEFDLLIATATAEAPPGPEIVIQVASTKTAGARPAGRRFGTLVHAVLRDVPLDARKPVIEPMAEAKARVVGATAEESEAAVEAVASALAHPLLRRATASEQCHREWPLVLKLEAADRNVCATERVLEGVVDLAYQEDGGWTIVDFKTDAALSPERYQRQLAWYVYAVGRLTGQPARGWLLNV